MPFTSLKFERLNRLKASAMSSISVRPRTVNRLLTRTSTIACMGMVSLLRPTLLAGSAGTRRARSDGNAPPSPSPFRSAPASGVNGRPEPRSRLPPPGNRPETDTGRTRRYGGVDRASRALARARDRSRQAGPWGSTGSPGAVVLGEKRGLKVRRRILGLRERVRDEELMRTREPLVQRHCQAAVPALAEGRVLEHRRRRGGAIVDVVGPATWSERRHNRVVSIEPSWCRPCTRMNVAASDTLVADPRSIPTAVCSACGTFRSGVVEISTLGNGLSGSGSPWPGALHAAMDAGRRSASVRTPELPSTI